MLQCAACVTPAETAWCLQNALRSRVLLLACNVWSLFYWKWSMCWYLIYVYTVYKPPQIFFPPVNNRDLCAVKEGPLWMSSMVCLQQQTHRWGWFSSLCSADESEILGLVSTEWGRSVLCHHWYVIWRCCGGEKKPWEQQKTLRDTKCSLRCS